MKQLVNSFIKGMNLDTTKLGLSNDQYREAFNFRLNSDGKSISDNTGALTNIEGNLLSLTYPKTSNVLKLEVTSLPITQLSVNFTLNGVIISGIVNSFQDIVDLINNNTTLNDLNNPRNPVYSNIRAASNDEYILIWAALNSNNNNLISISYLVNQGVTISSYISSQSNLKLIGWSLIRERFILFTTNNTTKNPGGHDESAADPSSISQMWSLDYDPVSLTPTLILLRNNYDDYTPYHPFRKEGQSEGKYENSKIEKVYWTDNFNELRNFNTKDPNGFAIKPDSLNVKVDFDISVPILQKINDSGGNLSRGVYQCSYRLTTNSGSKTKYTEPSNLVYIINSIPDPPSTPFKDYYGTGNVNSGKTITWKISNIDTDYDRIEIIVLFRLFPTDVPTIDQVFDNSIPSDGIFKFTYTGNEVATPISINDFFGVTNGFTHCKTITSKDNLLIAANTRNKKFDVDFDARAYRFNYTTVPGGNYAQINDSQGTPTIIFANNISNLPTLDWGISETHDCINPNQDSPEDASQIYSTYFRYQSNGTTLGGEGPNIKYTFNVKAIIGDVWLQNSLVTGDISNWRFINPQPNAEIVNCDIYENNGMYDSFKSPYKSSVLKGYQHDEIYSYAIIFYDSKGNSSFAKWIGDIRMPLMIDNVLSNPRQYSISDRLGWSGWQQLKILHPTFTVTIPQSLKNKLGNKGGFRIVRCERKTTDKTVLGAGTLHPILADNSTSSFWIGGNDQWDGNNNQDNYIAAFSSPEFTFMSFPGFKANDKIRVIAKLTETNNATGTNTFKLYDIAMNLPDFNFKHYIERILNEAIYLGLGNDTNWGTWTVHNHNLASSPANVDGEPMVAINWHNTGQSLPLFFYQDSSKYYALYKRDITNQYGGNSYSQRADREYISTGQYQSFNSGLSYSVDVFGGDVFTTIWDHQRQTNTGLGNQGVMGNVSYYNPVTTTLNTEWRNSYAINILGHQLQEDYSIIYKGFSHENNIKKFYTKPVIFNNIEENDNRIWASGYKTNGEIIDSWGIFAPLDFEDANGQYGPINNLQILKDLVIGFQNQGIFMIPVNQKILIPDNAASTLQLGTGTKLQRPVYISTNSGGFHQFGNIATENYIYFFDVNNLTLNRISNQVEDLSESKGISSVLAFNGDILKRDNIIDNINNNRAGVVCSYDTYNGEVLFTFYDYTSNSSSFTIVYNEQFNVFTSFYDFKPFFYLNNKRHIISPDSSLESLYLHNEGNPGEFYGTQYDSLITLILNPNEESVFDNCIYISECKDISTQITDQNTTLSEVRVSNDYQNSDYKTLTPGINIKREKRSWKLTIPRNIIRPNLVNPDILNPINFDTSQLFKARMKSSWLKVDFKFKNKINNKWKKIIIPFISTSIRTNVR